MATGGGEERANLKWQPQSVGASEADFHPEMSRPDFCGIRLRKRLRGNLFEFEEIFVDSALYLTVGLHLLQILAGASREP